MNPEFSFDRPTWLLCLVVPPMVWLWLLARERARAAHLLAWLGPRASALRASDPKIQRRAQNLFAVGLACALLALAGPRLGAPTGAIETAPMDLVVCLDLSRSMLARDGEPTRLDSARAALGEFLHGLRGERVALVLFAGEAKLRVPATDDYDSLLSIANEVGPESLEKGGTDLGAALRSALSALPKESERARAILLLTDGEDLHGSGQRQAEECARQAAPVFCLGLGSTRGSRIAFEEDGVSHYLRDANGVEILTAHDPRSLSALAASGGGRYRPRAQSLSLRSEVLRGQPARTEVADALSEASVQPRAALRYQWPLCLACLVWFLAFSLNPRRQA